MELSRDMIGARWLKPPCSTFRNCACYSRKTIIGSNSGDCSRSTRAVPVRNKGHSKATSPGSSHTGAIVTTSVIGAAHLGHCACASPVVCDSPNMGRPLNETLPLTTTSIRVGSCLFPCEGNLRKVSRLDCTGCSRREIDHPSMYKRPSVVDSHHDGLAIFSIRDANPRSTWQRPMSCCYGVLIKEPPTGNLRPT
jgi:hypothetical protein